jgi:hypothetical protein
MLLLHSPPLVVARECACVTGSRRFSLYKNDYRSDTV